MHTSTDYYTVLEVDPGAEPATLRVAYRALARRYHPDMPGGSGTQMVELNAAWSALRDPVAREAYDRRRSVAETPQESHVDASIPQPKPGSTVLDFGRYAGWSVDDLARHDPDFLDWLAHSRIGRPYRAEIERLLARPPHPPAFARADRRGRRGLFARRRGLFARR